MILYWRRYGKAGGCQIKIKIFYILIGGVAQLGEHLPCKQGVMSSNLTISIEIAKHSAGYDIQLFLNIKELKRRGLQLRAIKKLIPQITASMSGFAESGAVLLEGITEDISEEGQSSAKEGADTKQSTDTAKAEICNNEKILEFQTILERLIAQELRSQNEDEERCRSLDFAIRRQQMARREAAAASEKKGKSKHWDGVGRK